MNGTIIKIWDEPAFEGRAHVGIIRCMQDRKKYKIDLRWTPDNGNELSITKIEDDMEGNIEVYPACEVSEDELNWYIYHIDWRHPYESLRRVYESPFLSYTHIGFCLEEFIKLTKTYKDEFTGFCEIAITENGVIFLATPRHSDIVKWLHKKKFRNICQVWYDSVEVPNMTESQKKILDRLEREGLIKLEGK